VSTLGEDGATPVNLGGGGGGSVASTDITDSTSTWRAVLTAASQAAARTAIGAAAAAGAVSLDAANVFTDLQTLSKSSSTWGAPIPVAAFRHNNGGGSSWQGVAVRFEVKNDSAPAISYGYVVARAYGVGGDANNNLVEMRPAHSAGDPPVGLRVRCAVASAIWGVELLLAADGGSPTFQPCRDSGSGDVDLTLQGLGAGVVRLPAATGFVGTVTEITALTRPAGVMAFATNASGGPKPCWSTGSAWVLADGSALS